MIANELERLRNEVVSFRDALTNHPVTCLQDVECRLESIADSIRSIRVIETELERDLLREVIRLLGDLTSLCEQAGEFYGVCIGTLASIAGGYDGFGVPAFAPLRPVRVTARG